MKLVSLAYLLPLEFTGQSSLLRYRDTVPPACHL
uniref:Uncharacterized protein n=1 Tax=Anguilla anguilla TaxID=7936 RepID=A0A0E9ULG1_ANGAN